MTKLPWLEYAGQTTTEVLACKNTHRIDSLLCALEEGLYATAKATGEDRLAAEERLVLAVMALDREVHNGGFEQFFLNSSRRFVPIIAASLRRIGCEAAAAITERAMAAANLPTPARDEILNSCNNEFYRLPGNESRLFAFVEAHQDAIRLSAPPRPPLPGGPSKASKASNTSKLYARLGVAKVAGDNLEEIRRAAREFASKDRISATGAEIEGAAVLYAFSRAIDAGDLAACDQLAPRAFELTRGHTMHCVQHRNWAMELLHSCRPDSADSATLTYLEYLRSSDQSTLSTQNRVLFWAAFLQQHRPELPRSVAFFRTAFPHEDLDKPLPVQRFTQRAAPSS